MLNRLILAEPALSETEGFLDSIRSLEVTGESNGLSLSSARRGHGVRSASCGQLLVSW